MLRKSLVALCVGALVLLPAFAVNAADDPVVTQGSTLVVGAQDEMKTRNVYAWIAWEDPHTMAVLARVYDTPVQRDAATGAVVPRLAVGIDQDDDARLDPAEVGDFTVAIGTTDVTVFYDFQNARFHDGADVTAFDVLLSYHAWALHPKANGPVRPLMDLGGGAGSNFTTNRWLWVLPADDGDGNPRTDALRFSMQFPYANFAWATLGIPILPRHIWEGTGGGLHADFGTAVYPEGHPLAGQGVPSFSLTPAPFDAVGASSWNVPDAAVIGSGHFRFATWINGVEARLDANLDYAFGPPKVDGIRFKVYKTQQLGVLAIQNGDIDLYLDAILPDFIPELQRPGITVTMVEDLFPTVLYFNVRRQPWGYSPYPPVDRSADVGAPLRDAVNHVINRQSIFDNLVQRFGEIARGMVSPANDGWYNASLPLPPYDPSQAAAILDAGGFGPDPPGNCTQDTPTGCRSLPGRGQTYFEILTPTAGFDPVLASTGAMIADAMRQVGLNAVSRPMAFGEFLTLMEVHDFDLALRWRPSVHTPDGWTLSRADPDYLRDGFHSTNAAAGANVGGFWDAEFNQVADASRLAYDFMPRDWYVRYAQGILAEQLPAIPIVYRDWTWAYRDRFTGWVFAGTTVFNYWTLQGLEASANPGPTITLASPPDGAIIRAGTVLDFEVTDTDLVEFRVAVDDAATYYLAPPFDLATVGWADGLHYVNATARDSAANVARADYTFTLDSTPPTIELVSPPAESLLRAGRTIDLGVADAHLASVAVRADSEAYQPLAAPYDVVLEDLLTDGGEIPQGPHTLEVAATDLAGNLASFAANFTLDTIAPEVIAQGPTGPVLPGASVTATFSEAVDRASVESAFSLTDGTTTWRGADGTFAWSEDNRSFAFVPSGGVVAGRTYEARLGGTLTDVAGNPMDHPVSWTFTTVTSGVSGVDVGLWLGLLAVIVLLLLAVLLRRRKGKETEATPPEKTT